MGLTSICNAAAIVTALSTLAVIIVAIVCILFILRSANKHIDKISDSLPKVVEVLENASIPPQVLIALCDDAGITINELLDYYAKEAMERKLVAEKTFGVKNTTTQKFLKTESQFVKEGYVGEEVFARYTTGGGRAEFKKE